MSVSAQINNFTGAQTSASQGIGEISTAQITTSTKSKQRDSIEITQSPKDIIRLKKALLRQQISELITNSKISIDQAKGIKKLWNEKIVSGLGLEKNSKLKNLEGTEFKDISGHIDEIQFRSLIKPKSIKDYIWKAIPDKFEAPDSTDIKDIGNNDLKWRDFREGISYEDKYFQRLKDHYDLDILGTEFNLKRIKLLETNGWKMCNGDVCVQLTADQIETLNQNRKVLEKEVSEQKKAKEQMDALSITLRLTKTAKNILNTDGEKHINKNFIQKYIKEIKETPPHKRLIVLEKLKRQVGDLLNDFYKFQNVTLQKFDGIKDKFDTSNQKTIEQFVSRIFDKLTIEFGEGFGNFIASNHNLPSNIKNPLGEIPDSNLSNITNPQIKEGYKNLYSLFADVYNGKAKLSFQSLSAPNILPKIQEQLNKDKTPNTVDKKDYPEDLQDKKETLSPTFIMDKDINIKVVESTKKAFDTFFVDEKKVSDVGVQVGFVPFASNKENQNKVELILNSPKYSKLFNFPSSDKIDWNTALLSRVMYLYNQFVNSMKSKTQEKIDKISL
ncbi:MAG: hypothetical protein QNJ31_05100 [Candidatus Caenarcaniphilales bacterium]|nr:hypothetical protein [Candidatus Caenarcaniphilales bacterium]